MNGLTYYVPCVHRMPCGFCDIKKEACNYGNGVTITPTPTTVTAPYKIEPNWDEATCSAERSEE